MSVQALNVGGISVFASGRQEALREVERLIDRGRGGYVCFTGAHGLSEAHYDASVRAAHEHATLVLPDGIPLVWVGRCLGLRGMQQIAGPSFLPRLMEDAAGKGWRVFLFGATPQTLQAAAERATALYPELQISGMQSPPFAPMSQWDHEGTLREIKKSRADVVLVALSTPKQELWMSRTASQTQALLCGVGAAIDVYAGLQGQAPRWIRGSGLEWAYRLVREPRRLWRRYAMAVPTFVWLLVRRPPSLAPKP